MLAKNKPPVSPNFFSKHVWIMLGGILLLTIFLRFFNYTNRWGLAADQARDVLVARQALILHQLPLIGPFSASGPYVFGPYWYWFLMIPIGLFPHTLLAPWIFLTSFYVVSVGIVFLIGRKILTTQFGLLLALLTAVSFAQTQLPLNLIQSALVGFLAVAIYYFYISYLKQKKIFQLVSMSFLVGIAINTHFEAAPLTILLPLAIIFWGEKWSYIIISIITFLIPFVPLSIFNVRSNSYEFTHIFLTNAPVQHILFSQSIIDFGKREVIFFTTFLPRIWIRITGNPFTLPPIIIGTVYSIVFLVGIIIALLQRKTSKEIKIILLTAAILLVIIGSYKGALFENFLAYVDPLLLIIVTWVGYRLLSTKKILGVIFILLIITNSFVAAIKSGVAAVNTEYTTVAFWQNKLLQEFPHKTFSIYNYTEQNKDKGLSLSMILDVSKNNSDDGVKIGVAYVGAPLGYPVLLDGPEGSGLRLYNLDGVSENQLQKDGFVNVNKSSVYTSVEDWYK